MLQLAQKAYCSCTSRSPTYPIPEIGHIHPSDITDTREWVQEMLRRLEMHDPVGKILAVNDDILGAYIYRADVQDEFATNNARIVPFTGVSLAWCRIGSVAASRT